MMRTYPRRTWVAQEAVACPDLMILYGHGTYGPVADNEMYWDWLVAMVHLPLLVDKVDIVASTESNFIYAMRIVSRIDYLQETPGKTPLFGRLRSLCSSKEEPIYIPGAGILTK